MPGTIICNVPFPKRCRLHNYSSNFMPIFGAGGEDRPELVLTNHGDELPFSSIVCPVAVLPSATFDRFSPYPPLANSFHTHFFCCFYTSSFSVLHPLDSALTSVFSSSFLSVLKLRSALLSRLRSPRNLHFVLSVSDHALFLWNALRRLGEVVSTRRGVFSAVVFRSVDCIRLLDDVFGVRWDCINYELKYHQVSCLSYQLVLANRGRVAVDLAVINHEVPGSDLPRNKEVLAIHDAMKLKVADLEQRVNACDALSQAAAQSVATSSETDKVSARRREKKLKRQLAKLRQSLEVAQATMCLTASEAEGDSVAVDCVDM